MVNNKFYYYDGWTAKVGENGVNSVTFKLAPESQMADQAEVDRVKGDGQSNYLTTGSSMDAMGIPYYQNQINEFLRNFTQAFNDIEKQGVTLDGDKMGAFLWELPQPETRLMQIRGMRKYRRQRKTDGQRILNCHPTGTAIISLQRQPLQ